MLTQLPLMETYAQSLDLPNNSDTIVYVLGGMYYVKDLQNKIIKSSDTPDIVISTALARGGEIYIAGGAYYLTTNFSGFDIKFGTHLKMAKNADFFIPSGYSGYVFRFNSGSEQCIIDGGHIQESSPPKRNWIGILMQGGASGVADNLIENMVITYPQIAIDFNAATGQWINANTFVNVQAESFVKGIEFDFIGKHTAGVDGFYGNTFRDLQFQSGTMTTYGVKGIKHEYTAFYNVHLWDLPSRAISSTIDSSAEDTIIVGGQMTYQGFIDDGTNTIILDSWHNDISSNSTSSLALLNGTYKPIVSVSTPKSYGTLNMSIPQQFASGTVKGSSGQIILSQEYPSEINIYGSVPESTGGKVLLQITRPDGIVEQNQAYVTSDGTFYYPMVFDRNSLIGKYKIDASYQNHNLGSLVIMISDQISEKQNSTATYAEAPSESNAMLVADIKDIAKSWSQGQMTDTEFSSNIENILNSEIAKNSQSKILHIPHWFQNDVDWWLSGQISDDSFISTLQYVIDNGTKFNK